MKRWSTVLVPLLILAGALVLRAVDPAPVQQLRLLVFDTWLQVRPREYNPEAPVRIVDIDDESLERLGQWPWPRTVIAGIIDRLGVFGAQAVALDIVFAEPDRTSPGEILRLWTNLRGFGTIAEQVRAMPSHDTLLAATIRRVPVVTGFILVPEEIGRAPARRGNFASAGDDPLIFLRSFAGAVNNLPEIEDVAAGNGALNWHPDRDNVVRRAPLIVAWQDRIYPTLGAEALRVALRARTGIIKASGASGQTAFGEQTGINSIRIGPATIPTDATGQVIVHFTPHRSERYIPAWQVLEPDFSPSRVAGQVIVIGTSAAGLGDIRATPLGPMPGVEVHAQVLEQVLSGTYIHRPDLMVGAETAFLVLLGGSLIFIGYRFSALTAAMVGGVMGLLAFGSSWIAWTGFSYLVDPVFPSAMALLIYLTQTVISYLRVEGERRQVRDAFSHYMSPDVVEQLARHPERLTLGGESRELTLLFCDIRGFTSIAENLDAEQLTRLINRFLTPMTDVILSHHGTIDKYMGDCIMAFWNAPLDVEDHATEGCRAAIGMTAALERLNRELVEEAAAEGRRGTTVGMGVGLATGRCVVGNVGSEQRFDYSVLGDIVNLASRYEGMTRIYGVDLIIADTTRQAAPGMATLELDLIRVKGRREPTRIHALLGGAELAEDAGFQRLRERHEALLTAWRGAEWDRVGGLLDECGALDPEGRMAGPYELYRGRLDDFRQTPPGPDWDGVYTARTK